MQLSEIVKKMLRYYIIDLQAILFMFNLSQASASAVGPIRSKLFVSVIFYNTLP